MSTRRGILSTMTAGAALLAVKEIASAKDNKPGGGFGATASVSVNSGNNSGNMNLTYQENQAVITSAGDIALQQGNAAGGGTVQQGQVETLPPTGGDGSAAQGVCPPMISLNVATSDSTAATSDWYVPLKCACNYCQGGS